MKKVLSLMIFAAAFSIISLNADAQVYYSYTYYDHPYELPVYVNSVVRDHYHDCHLVKARSYSIDNDVNFNLVFSRGDTFMEIFVDSHGRVIRRVNYTYNPVTYVWVSPHHQHYYVNGHHHADYYKKHHHGDYHGHHPAHHDKDYYNHGKKHQSEPAKTYGKRDNKKIYQASNSRTNSSRSESRATERYHSYARR